MEQLVKEQKAAAALEVSRSYLQKARSRGDGPPFVKIGNAIRYRQSDIDAFIKANARGLI